MVKRASDWHLPVSLLTDSFEMLEKLTTYDPAEDICSEEAIAVCLAETRETNDATYIAHVLDVAARAKDMVIKSYVAMED